nr:HAD hydrolase family protein [Heyndrickxia camelliae]
MNHYFDIIRNNVNKGTSVKRVLDYLGIPIENSIAFGDGLNDKEMLCCAGEGFAMGNSHPELFKYAKHKTTDVMDSGIYNGLKLLGLLE